MVKYNTTNFKEIDLDNVHNSKSGKQEINTAHLYSDYIIFITQKYRNKKTLFLCLKKHSLRSRLENYQIQCINYEERHKYYKDEKYAFNDGEILPNVIYKKMELGAKNIYFPIETYPIKQILYKIRSFIQVCETLGACAIHIKYNKVEATSMNINQDLNVLAGSFKFHTENTNSDEKDIVTTLSYDKTVFSSQICLNVTDFEKYLENNDSHFLISFKDYNTDINLRYLVRSRLFSNLKKYSTTFTMNNYSTIDFSLMGTLNDYGLCTKFNKKKMGALIIDISVEFHEFENIIGSDNAPLDDVGFKWIRRRYYKNICNGSEPNSRPTIAFIRRLCLEKDQKALEGEFNEYAKKLFIYETFYGTQSLLNKANNLNYWVDVSKFLNILENFNPIDMVQLNEEGLQKIYHLCDNLSDDDKLEYLERFLRFVAIRRNLVNEYDIYIKYLRKESKINDILHIWDWTSVEALISMLKSNTFNSEGTNEYEMFNLFKFYDNIRQKFGPMFQKMKIPKEFTYAGKKDVFF